MCIPLKETFDNLFPKTFSKKANTRFLGSVNKAFLAKDWGRFIKILRSCVQIVKKKFKNEGAKRRNSSLRQEWNHFSLTLTQFEVQKDAIENHFAFDFIEGPLVKAVRDGSWVLLDEINLASADTLESLSGLLEGGSLCLTERGDTGAVARHPNFRIFACMNPPTGMQMTKHVKY